MIFATDLDRTMIYSNRMLSAKDSMYRTVESLDSRVISYMDLTAITMIENARFMVLPVTTRSIEQFKRVEIFNSLEWAVCTNGGTVLHNGEIDLGWDKHIHSITSKLDFDEAISWLEELEEINDTVRVVDGKFVYSKTSDIEATDRKLKEIVNKDWHYTIQGKKVYIIPKGISKSNAIKYIMGKLKETYLVTAGDGKLDVDMLGIGDIAFTPLHGEIYKLELYKGGNLVTVGDGITAAVDILNQVNEIYNSINV